MKQIFQHINDGKIHILDVPAPSLEKGHILIKNYFSAISAGTERALIRLAQKNILEKAKARPDLVQKIIQKIKTEGLLSVFHQITEKLDSMMPLGYSSAGEVIEVGDDINDIKKGDTVACVGSGYANHAEIVAVPKNLVVKIPPKVAFEEASFAALGAIALHGIRRANLTPGEHVAVIGLGLIGQITVQILNAYGFKITGFDIDESKINLARQFGASEAYLVNKGTIPQKSLFDATIVTAATASNEPLVFAGEITRKKGRVVLVGDVKINIPRKLYYEKEIDLLISCSYGPGRYDKMYEEKGIDYPLPYVRWTEQRNVEEFLHLLSAKKITMRPLISAVYPIDDAVNAYDRVLNDPSVFTVLLHYSENSEQKTTKSIFPKHAQNNPIESNEPINIGIIGAGNFAQKIILPILAKNKNIRVKGISIKTPSTLQSLEQRYQPDYITTDVQKIISDDDIQLVVIATPHHLHATHLTQALKNKKQVYIEKPLCITPQELKDIIAFTRNETTFPYLFIGFNRRFSPFIQEAQKIFSNHSPLHIIYRVNAGAIPPDHWINDPQKGGGRIVGETCHFIDTICAITNAQPISVNADSLDSDKNAPYENINAQFTLSDGSTASLIYMTNASSRLPKEYIEIHGDSKSVIIDDFKKMTIYKQNKTKKIRRWTQDKGHTNEIETFIKTILNGDKPPIALEEIFLTTLTTFKIIESIRLRTPQKIDLNFLV
ncbi:MAG: bi-domain-containing oxidoreductase [Parcubacteria group bacterium]|nr:bi-domain-containing oxidoreductase [Parcubacteria group bacterium]